MNEALGGVGHAGTIDHSDVLKLGSLLFNNACLHFFLNSKLPSLYSRYHDDAWWDTYVEYVMGRQSEYKISAIFCDEVHGVLERHVGLILHEDVHQAIPRVSSKTFGSEQEVRLKQIFDAYDSDKDGYLLWADFERLCSEISLPGLPEHPSAYWKNETELKQYPAMSLCMCP